MLTEMEAKVLNFLVEEKERYKEKFNLKASEEFYNECVLYLEETMKEIE